MNNIPVFDSDSFDSDSIGTNSITTYNDIFGENINVEQNTVDLYLNNHYFKSLNSIPGYDIRLYIHEPIKSKEELYRQKYESNFIDSYVHTKTITFKYVGNGKFEAFDDKVVIGKHDLEIKQEKEDTSYAPIPIENRFEILDI